jgi:hypothetical protein
MSAPRRTRRHSAPVTLALALAGVLLASCGRKDTGEAPPDSPAGGAAEGSAEDAATRQDTAAGTATATDAPAPQASGQPATDPTTAPLAVADIERWEKGMAAEIEAVREAAGKMKAARSGTDTISAMMGVQEMATLAAGARAAGVDENRYRIIRSNLSAAVSQLAPPELGGLDTTMLSPAQREELRQSREAQLAQMQGTVPADVVEALRPRAAELKKKELELVGARLKGAGM